MPLASDLHPEFGYIGNAPAVLRKFGFAIAFLVVGLIAAISNFSVFVREPDDPMKAMALAPERVLNSAAAPAAPRLPLNAVESPSESAPESSAGASRSCGGAITADSGIDCIPTRMRRPRAIPAANERPAIAAVAIGHPDKPVPLPAEPVAPVAGAEPSTADVSATPAEAPVEAAAAEPEAPAVTVVPSSAPARKSHGRSNHAHRDRGDYARSGYRSGPSYSYHSMQAGYARVW